MMLFKDQRVLPAPGVPDMRDYMAERLVMAAFRAGYFFPERPKFREIPQTSSFIGTVVLEVQGYGFKMTDPK